MAKNAQIVFVDDNPNFESRGDIPVSFTKHEVRTGINGKSLGFNSGECAAYSRQLRDHVTIY